MSNGQGIADGDQLARALRAEGVEGRNRAQIHLLENEELNEAVAASHSSGHAQMSMPDALAWWVIRLEARSAC